MDNIGKKPSKGILRVSSKGDQPDNHKTSTEPIKWDEMNILQTLHPPEKDYGLMKIEEPKTPYSHYKETVDGELISDEEDTASSSNLDPQIVSDKIKHCRPRILPQDSKEAGEDINTADQEGSESDSEWEELTDEEKKKRKEFEMKRKIHYNEFQAAKLARKLLEEDEEDDEDEDKY